MQTITLSEPELLLLQAIEALGGDAHISALKGAIRWQARRNTHKALGLLHDRGLLNRYARGCYTLTAAGRTALNDVDRTLATAPNKQGRAPILSNAA